VSKKEKGETRSWGGPFSRLKKGEKKGCAYRPKGMGNTRDVWPDVVRERKEKKKDSQSRLKKKKGAHPRPPTGLRSQKREETKGGGKRRGERDPSLANSGLKKGGNRPRPLFRRSQLWKTWGREKGGRRSNSATTEKGKDVDGPSFP